MGQSTDAILAWGVPLGEGEELPWDEDEEAGWAAPGKSKFELYDWLEHRLGPELAGRLEVVEHCSCDYPMHFLAIRGTETRASRGCPERVEPSAGSDWREVIRQAVKRLGPAEAASGAEPGWYVFSMWC